MSDRKLLFIYNPHAGKEGIRSKLLDIIDIFTKAGYEVTAYPTQKQGDAIDATLKKAHKYEILACCGGDGTLDEVVTAMMMRQYKIPIGYVPAGTTNDFAKSLGIPSNMLKAAQAIVDGKKYACDIGSFNDDTFVYIAAFGMFTDVPYETDQGAKNILGHMAYILEGAKRLGTYPSYHIRVKSEEMEIEDDFLFGMVSNSRSAGGFKNITGKHVHMNDGVFEVTLIRKPKNVIEFNMIMASLVGATISAECMYCFKTAEITFECDDIPAWTLDGEYGGEYRTVVIRNENQALEVMIPEKNE